MKRVVLAVVLSVVVPGVALAQRALPVPPVPPMPPAAPMAPPAPAAPSVVPVPPVPPAVSLAPLAPLPPVAPAAPLPPVPPVYAKQTFDGDWAIDLKHDFNFDLQNDFHFDFNFENLKLDVEQQVKNDIAMSLGDKFFYGQGVGIAGRKVNSDSEYQSGLGRMQQRQYEQAIESFNKVIANKAERVDAALYWKGYIEFRLGRSDDALASLAALRRDYPSSRYLGDAKVLEAEVKRTAGRSAAAVASDDDEIKLLAIQGLSKTGEAVPLLENVLAASNSLGVKRRALYVLALSSDPKANEVLMRYARGGGNPDLQVEAIRYLGERSATLNPTQLLEIFSTVEDVRVKIAVIDAFRAKNDKPALIKLAADRQIKDDIRPHLFGRMSGLVTSDDVMSLYRGETDPMMRAQILSSLGNTLSADQLAQIARTDADNRVRQRAIGAIGGRRNEDTSKALVSLYQAQTDRDVRRSVIGMLAGQRNAEALVALAKQETDLDLKRDLVRRISDMASSNKAAQDFLMEQLR
jgi:HEAT repeat protein